MKSEIRLALLALAAASAPAFAQDNTPQCASLFDSSQNMFTAKNAPAGALNQQCFLTVLPKNGASSDANFPRLAQYPAPQLGEGTYEILLSGGGGGGGGGAMFASGGGGAGAVPVKTTQYLTPGIYKLTIGTSGHGGTTGITGGPGGDGNPTSMTKAYTNETIAGFAGADARSGTSSGGSAGNASGTGGSGVAGQGTGGDGGRQANKNGSGEKSSQDGAPMHIAGISTGAAGKGGSMDGGGGGGAGYGNGGDARSGVQPNSNDLPGGNGGDGFVMLRPIQLAQATPAAVAASAQAPAKAYVAPERAHKKDRN